MLSASRLLVAISIILLVLGPPGYFLGEDADFSEGIELASISIPLTYSAWQTWRALKPTTIGRTNFIVAHFLPGVISFLGIIFLFAPNKIFALMTLGASMLVAGGVIILKIHSQRRHLPIS